MSDTKTFRHENFEYMKRRLPSLNALRAFESAARHLSFTRAADELNVTQAAISHQVKALEDQIGIMLFQRRNRQLILTDAGQTLLPDLIDAFDAMDSALARVKRRDQAGILIVATMDSLAAAWLMPRPIYNRKLFISNRWLSFHRALCELDTKFLTRWTSLRLNHGPVPGHLSKTILRKQ